MLGVCACVGDESSVARRGTGTGSYHSVQMVFLEQEQMLGELVLSEWSGKDFFLSRTAKELSRIQQIIFWRQFFYIIKIKTYDLRTRPSRALALDVASLGLITWHPVGSPENSKSNSWMQTVQSQEQDLNISTCDKKLKGKISILITVRKISNIKLTIKCIKKLMPTKGKESCPLPSRK